MLAPGDRIWQGGHFDSPNFFSNFLLNLHGSIFMPNFFSNFLLNLHGSIFMKRWDTPEASF